MSKQCQGNQESS